MKLVKLLIIISIMLLSGKSWTKDILPANQVFIPTISAITDRQIIINIDIKPSHYIYRQRSLSIDSIDNSIVIDKIELSDGNEKTDDFFGTQSVWYGKKNVANIIIDYQNINFNKNIKLRLKYQGCYDGVICYPIQTVYLPIQLPTKINNNSNIFKQYKKNNLLPEKQAFPFTVEFLDDNTLSIHWHIADNYYIYQDKILIKTANLSKVQLSTGEQHQDVFFGKQIIYRNNSGIARIYLSDKPKNQILDITFQGCADKGVCYPTIKHKFKIGNGKVRAIFLDEKDKSLPIENTVKKSAIIPKQDSLPPLFTKIINNNIWLNLALLLTAGIALAFTPCVLPMTPILLGIITNQQQIKKSKAIILSSSYALGVATMMAIFGLIVSKTNINLYITFQKPLWIILFATIFIVMGLAMLGVFNFTTPKLIQNKIYAWQNILQQSRAINLFIIGALSALILGPCITPPLIAILAFIATTNNAFLGAIYLFAFGLGTSLPLVVFSTTVSAIPKTGGGSQLITKFFALMMFAVSLWLLSRLFPGALALFLWGLLMIFTAWIFWHSQLSNIVAKILVKILAITFLLLGMTWIIGGGFMGNKNPLKPFTKVAKIKFHYINNLVELQNALTNSNKPVMLDLYADWCISCQEIEHITFNDHKVINLLKDFTLLKIDITNTQDDHKKLLNNLQLIGPPALLFFKNNKEIDRHIGIINATDLLLKLQQIRNN